MSELTAVHSDSQDSTISDPSTCELADHRATPAHPTTATLQPATGVDGSADIPLRPDEAGT